MSMGYLNRNEGYGSVNQDFVGDFPQIAGVAGHNVPPQMTFSDGFAQFGNNAGINVGNVTTRPTFIINDMVTWTRGTHTLKAGMEYRKIMGNIHTNGNQAGTFNFARGATGLDRRQQRQPDRELPARRRRQRQLGLPRRRLVVPAADRVDPARRRHVAGERPLHRSTTACAGTTTRRRREKYDRFSFFDPVGANPGAGGRPGPPRLRGRRATARPATAPRYPEEDWYGGFAPRLGAVYSLNDKTVFRTGWGIFYTQAFYPGWGGGISQDGFSNTPALLEHARRHPAGVLPGSGLPAELHSSRPTSAPTTATARASCIGRSTPTSGRTRTSGTSRSTASWARTCR